MIRIRDTQYSSTGALLTDAISIASYYGFVPFDDVPRPQVNSKKKMPTTEEVESALSFIRKDEKLVRDSDRIR